MSEAIKSEEAGGAAPAVEPAPAIVAAGAEAIQSPPPAPINVRADDGPRLRLHQVAAALSRGLNRQLLAEYLQLRRAVRQ
jgi:hypothetical protein